MLDRIKNVFGESRKGSDGTDASQDASGKPSKKQTKKNKKDMMLSVLNESVVETALEEFKKNTPFITYKHGEAFYGGLWLDTDSPEIGGINQRSKKDETKGMLIESINNGQIKVYIPHDLMEKNELVIIPDMVTMANIQEFGILVKAPYRFALIDNQGQVEVFDDWPMVYEEAYEIRVESEDADLESYLLRMGADWVERPEEEVEEAPVEDQEVEDLKAEGADYQDDDDSDYAYEQESLEEFVGNYSRDDEDGYEDFEEEELEEIDEDEVLKSMERVIFPDDLRLTLSTEPFDSIYTFRNDYVPLVESQGDSWLEEQVNQFRRDANHSLETLHRNNLLKLRETYTGLVMKLANETYDKYKYRADDKADLSLRYVEYYNRLLEIKEGAIANSDRTVSERTEELEKNWETKLDEVGRSAAEHARKQHRDRYGTAHEEALRQVSLQVREEIEREFLGALNQMHDERRKEAEEAFEYSLQGILKEVGDQYDTMIESEKQVREEWQRKIEDYIDEYRKDETARSNVLAEELAQKEKAQAVREEYTEKLQEQTNDHQERYNRLLEEMQKKERDFELLLDEQDRAAQEKYKQLQASYEGLQKERDDIFKRYQDIDKSKDEQYAKRIAEIKANSEEVIEQYEHTVNLQKYNRLITLGLSVVAIVASLALGVLFGVNMNVGQSTAEFDQAVMEEFNQRMDELETGSEAERQAVIDDIMKNAEKKVEADQAESTAEAEPVESDKDPQDVTVG